MNLEVLKTDLLARITAAQTLDDIEQIRLDALGKKGAITEAMKSLGAMSPDERRTFGAGLNLVKEDISSALEQKKEIFEDSALNAKLASEAFDLTLPPHPRRTGHIHPLSQTMEELVDIFGQMGFVVAEGPDIENDDRNFTALNIPASHPARQSHDTFYLNEKEGDAPLLLRTHTSPVQIRTMREQKPPIRIIVPGRTYRCDDDATHSPMFHQVEGLVIEKNIHMGHLKGVLLDFCRAFFEVDDVTMRLRPSFFPFTEPSAEVDIGCKKSADGLQIGAGADWLEILGCGMVHPNVLINCGLDPNEYQGFAFGMGIERLAMLKYGIPDLRPFYNSDTRWLGHYGFSAFDVPSLIRRIRQ